MGGLNRIDYGKLNPKAPISQAVFPCVDESLGGEPRKPIEHLLKNGMQQFQAVHRVA
jgi:hypothetical protein